ncbi:short-chain dehydrogenase [Mycobacterium sp. MS1601]|uniref:SDR family oxidoreductase n=1 Tax=Mycobacterium sp. MS1601 TaxID=1936029 RepID=UPI00097981FE|nr:SDR family oxidoreductase [Mycobacterium sp. MS1601]AQA05159.1 short-chain dehydrogenase [Mycobacterium sp. MS1601]
MNIAGSVALVTGANRGMGRVYAEALLGRGASKVYAAARNPEAVDIDGVVPIALDITDADSAAAAAAAATDVTLLINNAGVSAGQNLVTGDLDKIRMEMDTNFFGTLNVIRAFPPVLGGNGGGAILNMLSVLSWLSLPRSTSYSAAKAAAWSLTNGIRIELAAQGTQVTGLHVGAVDTDMTSGLDVPKSAPADVVAMALDGIEAGSLEVLADDTSRYVKSRLSEPPVTP